MSSCAMAGAVAKGEVVGSPSWQVTKAYLIWDAGFQWCFLSSLVAIGGGGLCAWRTPALQLWLWGLYQDVLFRLMEGASRMAWWSVIGLLSSSCCALQLMLNALNFGCVGFNTRLGPLRPFFCAVTVCCQAVVWYTAYDKAFQRVYVACSTAVVTFLTLLPELTACWVQRTAVAAGQNDGAAVARSRAVLALEGMGCAACTKKVAEVLDKVTSVRTREISLEAKEVRITLSCEVEDTRKLLLELAAKLRDVGFPATPGEVSAIAVGSSPEGAPAAGAVAGRPCAEPMGAEASASGCCGGVGGLPMSIGAGLLSSSCCLLQLGVNLMASLNLLHVGCAGFNKVLGPWRFHLRLLTGAWLSFSWISCVRRSSGRAVVRRLLLRTLLCLSLTFLPELLLWSGGPAVAPPTEGAQVLQLNVEGMGCEACQVHVQGVMDRMGGVIGSRVDFKAGRAELVVNKDWSFDFEALSRTLENDGYTATLRSDL